MRVSFLKVFLASYLLLALTFLVTYHSSIDSTTRTWEGDRFPLQGLCRVVDEPLPLRLSGLYKVNFSEGVYLITPNGAINTSGKVDLHARGIYIEFSKPLNETVNLRIKPVLDWRQIGLTLILSLAGGALVASAFRVLGFE